MEMQYLASNIVYTTNKTTTSLPDTMIVTVDDDQDTYLAATESIRDTTGFPVISCSLQILPKRALT